MSYGHTGIHPILSSFHDMDFIGVCMTSKRHCLSSSQSLALAHADISENGTVIFSTW